MKPSDLRRLSQCSLLVLAPVLGCVDTSPSSGRCLGVLDGGAVNLAMDPEPSAFHRDDDILGDEDGPFTISYGGGAVRVEGVFDDLPSARDLGTYRVPSEPSVDAWSLTTTLAAGAVEESTLTLTTASRERVAGSFSTRFAGGQLTCTLDLRRAYERDTDD
jgi:hypothetical protein